MSETDRPRTRRPRVLLADDYAPLLVSWRRILDASCDVVGAVSDGRDVLAAARAQAPDVVILDIAMPDVNGLTACRELKAAFPTMGVVLVSAFDDLAFQQAAEEAGAAAFVVKSVAADELERAIAHAVGAGIPFRAFTRPRR
jgi:DNA-binding NarL/FixJ family response regulator